MFWIVLVGWGRSHESHAWGELKIKTSVSWRGRGALLFTGNQFDYVDFWPLEASRFVKGPPREACGLRVLGGCPLLVLLVRCP